MPLLFNQFVRALMAGGGGVAPSPVLSGLLAEYRVNEAAGTKFLGYDSTGAANATLDANFLASFFPTWSGGGALSNNSVVSMPAGLSMATCQTLIIAHDQQPATYNATLVETPVLSFGRVRATTLALDGLGTPMWSSRPDTNNTKAPSGKRGPIVTAVRLTPAGGEIFLDGVPTPQHIRKTAPAAQGAAQSHFGWGQSAVAYQGRWYWASFYNRLLSDAEIAQQTTWIQSQVSLRGVSFADQTPANAPLVMVLGDSISEASNLPPGACLLSQLRGSLTTTCRFINLGKSGERTEFATATTQGLLTPIISKYSAATKKVLIIMLGTNDIGTRPTPLPAATCLANIDSIVSQARTAGVTDVILCSLVDGNNTYYDAVTRRPIKDAYDAGIRAGRPGVDYTLDIASDALIGVAGSATPTTYFVDGLHPNYAGTTRWRDLTLTALAARGIT